MATNENLIPIPGRLHSVATEGHVAGADEIFDDSLNKDQATINQEFNEAIGTGGSVDSRIEAAVNAEKTRAEGTEEALDGRIDTLEEAVGSGGSVDERIEEAVAPKANSADVYAKTETYNKTELNNMITTPNQEYVTVTATDQTTAVTDVLPTTGAADTIYRVGNWDGSQYDSSVYSEYAWNGSQYVHLSTKTQIGEVFDISAYHTTGGTLATYADLSAALDSNNGGGVPQSLQKGGMSVKFVQSFDNKYVQFRLKANAFTTDTDYWVFAVEGFYKEPIDYEFIEMNLDAGSKLISGRDKNGVLHENVGLNTPNIENIKFKNESAEIISIEREDFVEVVLDGEGKATESTEKNGTKNFYGNVVFHGDTGFINDRNWDNVIKNVKNQWQKQTIISYKKPNTLVDNINNFDNLMTACLFAVEHATANNQFEIEVYENIYATEESDFTPIPDSPIHSGVYDYNALFYTKEYIRIRGIGSPKIISGRMKKAGFTTNRIFYQPGFYQGGELENLIVLAENVKYCVHYESNLDHNNIGINGLGYIRECEFVHFGGEAELWGRETSLYQSWKAWGCGWIKGNLLVFDKCKLISYMSTAFSCHSSQSDIPVEIDFDSCHLIGADWGFSLETPLSSIDKCSVKLTNNYICGGNYDIVLFNGSAVNQTNVRIYGCNNTFKTFYGRSDKTFLLTALSTTEICRLIKDDAQIFGNNPLESDAEFGIAGYISGNSGGNGLNTRIGNCSINSKQLSIQFGATLKTVVFNQDYTNVSVSDIIDYINTELSGFGIVSEQRPADNYYPEFTDVVVYKKNNGNEIINFGDYVTISGMNAQKLPSSSGADAICIEKCGIGQIAKFRTNIN